MSTTSKTGRKSVKMGETTSAPVDSARDPAQYWWADNAREPAKSLVQMRDKLRQRQQSRYDEMARYTQIYEYSFRAGWRRNPQRYRPFREDVLAFNHAQAIINSVVLEVASTELLVLYHPARGAFERQRASEFATDVTDSLLRALDFQAVRRRATRDYATCSIGLVGVLKRYGRLEIIRCIPNDVTYDEDEVRYGAPRSVWWDEYIDRSVAIERYKQKRKEFGGKPDDRVKAIQAAPAAKPDWESQNTGDTIKITHAWHLPNGPDATYSAPKGGRHRAAISRDGQGDQFAPEQGLLLEDEPYIFDTLPIVEFVPSPSHMGLHGIPPMRMLAAGQREHERVTARLQRSHAKVGGSHFVARRGMNFDHRQASNDSGDVWETDDDPRNIVPLVPTPAHPQVYEYLDSLPRSMHQVLNASTFVSQGEIPQGQRDITARALAFTKKSHQAARVDWFIEAEKVTLKAADLLFKWAGWALDQKDNELLDWMNSQLDLAEHEKCDWSELVKMISVPRMSVFSVPGLSRDPNQNFQELGSMLQSGAISVSIFRRLWRVPVWKPELDVEVADEDLVDHQILSMLTTGKQAIVEGEDKLDIIVDRTTRWIQYLRANQVRLGVPVDRIDLLRNYRDQAVGHKKDQALKAQALASQAGGPGAAVPAGASQPGAGPEGAAPGVAPGMPPPQPTPSPTQGGPPAPSIEQPPPGLLS